MKSIAFLLFKLTRWKTYSLVCVPALQEKVGTRPINIHNSYYVKNNSLRILSTQLFTSNYTNCNWTRPIIKWILIPFQKMCPKKPYLIFNCLIALRVSSSWEYQSVKQNNVFETLKELSRQTNNTILSEWPILHSICFNWFIFIRSVPNPVGLDKIEWYFSILINLSKSPRHCHLSTLSRCGRSNLELLR